MCVHHIFLGCVMNSKCSQLYFLGPKNKCIFRISVTWLVFNLQRRKYIYRYMTSYVKCKIFNARVVELIKY